MKNISILIKPASGLCNLNCKYCFYKDEIANRNNTNYGMISQETTENILNKFLLIEDLSTLTIAFQGGEPTLIGLDYYKNFIKLVNKKNINKVNILYTIQTNGTILNDEFLSFLKENNFLVGISLDGIKQTHDINRLDNNNNQTFEKVFNTIKKLKEYEIDFNILTVVTKSVAKNINQIYKFYKDNNFIYTQYIPVLNKINNKIEAYSITPHDYFIFLDTLFHLYYNDIKKGKYIYNRYFENIVRLLLNMNPEDCSLMGHCSIQFVIEANGNVYPCDFYCLDKYLLGNINQNDFNEILKNENSINFIKDSLNIYSKCKTCKYFKICRGGCKRNKDALSRNYYCSSYTNFFEKNIDKLLELAKILPLLKENA